MHIDLISTTKSSTKIIHGTENGKRTACGINLTKPENIGMYTSVGTMSDIVQLTCEKCKTSIAKKQIKEANKEMAALMKEEEKMRKKDRSSKHQDDEPMPSSHTSSGSRGSSYSSSSSGGEYVPPSMRRQMQLKQKEQPIEAPEAEISQQISVPAPNAGLPPVPPAPSAANNDVLSQFAIPAPNAAPPAANDDVLSQFAIPAPNAAPSAANDDVLSQFAMPAPNAAQIAANNDVLSQFAMPTPTPASAPAMPGATPESADVLSQFAIPSVPNAVPTVPTDRAAGATAANADDLLVQFSAPNAAPAQDVAANGAPILSAPDDILAQFSVPSTPVQQQRPNDPLDSLADSLFGGGAAQDSFSQQPDTSIPGVVVTDPTPVSSFASHFPSEDEIVDVTPIPAEDGLDAFTVPTVPTAPQPFIPTETDDLSAFTVPTAPVTPQPAASSQNDFLDDILLMLGNAPAPNAPSLATVPTAPQGADLSAPVLSVQETPTLGAPSVSVTPAAPAAIPDITNIPAQPAAQTGTVPTLNIPQAPPPQTTIPQAGYPMPGYPQQPVYGQPTAGYPGVAQQQYQPFAAPQTPKPAEPDTPTPLFVGYSADGRQLFQTYDAMGNPIPINEPVYSTPPETPKTGIPTAPTQGMPAGSAAPVMDLEDLMESMGIENPNKPVDDGKPINYSEYHMPEKKKRTTASSTAKPKASQASEEPTGPISAAEAKRRKKLEKINRDFEKKVRASGIDPKTGGILMDPKK